MILHLDDAMAVLQSGVYTQAISQIREHGMSVGVYTQDAVEQAKSHRGGSLNIGNVLKSACATHVYFSTPEENIEQLLQLTGTRKVLEVSRSYSEQFSFLQTRSGTSETHRYRDDYGLPIDDLLEVLRRKFHALVIPSELPPFAMRILMPMTREMYEAGLRKEWPHGKPLPVPKIEPPAPKKKEVKKR